MVEQGKVAVSLVCPDCAIEANQSEARQQNPDATRFPDSVDHHLRMDRNKRNGKRKSKEEKKKKSEFEFCNVCKLNHDQGQRHKYFPRHKESLSAFLTRFRTKIEDVRFFVRNPSVLLPEHASQNRVWCVFCVEDIVEIGSSFACAKAIHHLASTDHLKNLKHFLWKNGGGMDRIDKFRISQADVDEWEKKCQRLENGVSFSSQGTREQLYGPSNDIQHELELTIDNYENNSTHHLKSDYSNGVLPLQYNTNEYQISHSGLSEVMHTGSHLHDVSTYHSSGTHSWTWNSSNLTADSFVQQPLLCGNREYSGSGYNNSIEVPQSEKIAHGNCSSIGLQSIAPVSSSNPEKAGGNVHSGALPPWLDASDQNILNFQTCSSSRTHGSVANKSGKTFIKLNPKRVGAAWAERRKTELEMEKRGEMMKSDVDADWLPNFGRVWQSGTRKQSRKEFEKEKQKPAKTESNSEISVQIQPYVSKRMRRDDGEY